jgi:aryl-alcohol dehydrogenase-like predicted oxidoreductase
LFAQPAVTAPLVGVSKPNHITDAVAAVDLTLDDKELTRLAAHYVPQAPEAY